MAQLVQKKSKGGRVLIGKVSVIKPSTGTKRVGQGNVQAKLEAAEPPPP